MDLNNKIAVVTGAAQGIGKATALILSSYGADVVALDVNLDNAKKTVSQIMKMGKKGLAIQVDVTNKDNVESAINESIKKMERIDILVNAAGVAIASEIETMTEELWDKTMNINAKGVFLCSQAVIKNMKERKYGKIVNISSRAAKVGEIANSAYCCSKAAVSMFTQVLALEMARFNINVNAVCPGLVDTEMIQKAIVNLSREQGIDAIEFERNWVDEIPLKRMAKPEEVGELVAFLASEKADYITGASYGINGGTTMF